MGSQIDILSKYAQSGRYPIDLNDRTQQNANNALTIAQIAFNLIKNDI